MGSLAKTMYRAARSCALIIKWVTEDTHRPLLQNEQKLKLFKIISTLPTIP